MVGPGRFELPTYGLGIQRAVLIGVENFRSPVEWHHEVSMGEKEVQSEDVERLCQ